MNVSKTIKPFFIDDRGEMSHLLDRDTSITSVLLITCKKDSIRANHFHKNDTHYSYMLEGKMEYSYKNAWKKNAKVKKIIVEKGQIVKTPPNVMHAMKFLEKSVFLALTTEPRAKRQYEKDTVRVKLI